jgi:hypothetical protein
MRDGSAATLLRWAAAIPDTKHFYLKSEKGGRIASIRSIMPQASWRNGVKHPDRTTLLEKTRLVITERLILTQPNDLRTVGMSWEIPCGIRSTIAQYGRLRRALFWIAYISNHICIEY